MCKRLFVSSVLIYISVLPYPVLDIYGVRNFLSGISQNLRQRHYSLDATLMLQELKCLSLNCTL